MKNRLKKIVSNLFFPATATKMGAEAPNSQKFWFLKLFAPAALRLPLHEMVFSQRHHPVQNQCKRSQNQNTGHNRVDTNVLSACRIR